MLNKKTKIIILGVVILLLSAIFIFALKIKFKNKNEVTENGININILEELKSNHPEFTGEQLEFYEKVAQSDDENAIKQCLSRKDEGDCVSSVAFIKSDRKLCYIHGGAADEETSEEEEEKTQKKCVEIVLQKKADAEIDQCRPLNGDDFFNCLNEIFSIYDELSDCANLPEGEGRAACEEIFYYKEAYLKYDRELCAKIKNEKLNQYCLKNIIDKLQDTDGDGLTDLDEINNYKTHYLFYDSDGDSLSDGDEVKKYNTNPKNSDTDGDGYSDGDEVKGGYNPAGEGRLE